MIHDIGLFLLTLLCGVMVSCIMELKDSDKNDKNYI